jgi:hypothetical protein
MAYDAVMMQYRRLFIEAYNFEEIGNTISKV